jgi:hypothetical protein
LAQWFETILKFRFDIKTLLGVSIHPEKDTAVAVAQRLLKKLGLKLEFLAQLRVKGKHTRIYLGCKSDFDLRSLVFQNWLNRDERYAAIILSETNAA